MPEYLAPGVYVEEIDTGPKPIEGVSTSTAGMIGLAERGPADVPILLTGTGDYARWFGGALDRRAFGDNGHLPAAVEGFFRNGGRRLYVTRVVPAGAAEARMVLHGTGTGLNPRTNTLLRGVQTGDGMAAGTELLVLDNAGIPVGATVRIGDGSAAEWHDIGGVNAATTVLLSFPLGGHLAAGGTIRRYDRDVTAGNAGPHTLAGPVNAGSRHVVVVTGDDVLSTSFNLTDQLLEIALGGRREYSRVTAVVATGGVNEFRLTLAQPLQTGFPVADTTATVLTAQAAAPDSTATAGPAASAGDVAIGLTAAGGTEPILEMVPAAAGAPTELRAAVTPGRLVLTRALPAALPAGTLVEPVTLTNAAGAPTTLTAEAARGAVEIMVADRTNITPGRAIGIGTAPDTEEVLVAAMPGAVLPATGPGTLVLEHGLRAPHAAGTQVQLQVPLLPLAAPRFAGVLVQAAPQGATEILVTETASYAAGEALMLTTAEDVAYLQRIGTVTASAPQAVTLARPLARNHPAGGAMIRRAPLFDVEALDRGAWGNRLLVSVEEEESGLVARTEARSAIGTTGLELSSLAGIEPGTVLEMRDVDADATVGALLKITAMDRSTGRVTVAGAGLDAAQLAAVGAGRAILRSREFRLTVRLRRQDDPAVPSRGEQIQDSEMFRHLSMDPRHSRYAVRILGDIDGPHRRSDRRPEGESAYVRLRDMRAVADREGVDLGPEALTDRLPSGITRAARHPMARGNDALALLAPAVFLGVDDREPENRRGIFALKNIDDISIVAVPGQTDAQIQQALVNHCEELRYRFAVLDGPSPPGDSMADVQALRQRYDTKYAAIYHPWLMLPDPLPENLADIRQVPIPPAGHVLGIYARTDVERGVHKAPANEVVRGITGLRRYLNKAEHDLLNPFPVNINVIRDFRPDNRAIRIWGARVVTSDPDFKYVNVRRLMIFIEKSVDRGLQWVVFEPNAPPLWARVRRTISNFLTAVWRDGALEGTKPEDAFFVACDRTTMTQTDIDNGRLICVIGIAPVKPAEFVIIRIGLKTAEAEE
ncbi:phage tail sheath C-terminal domain-containing protein [Paracraurococcus lichenis]|uniref:Phage tail sheath subtilisin-like domain-containing protein n=1 Tax=Paracraurococcus lichenis TaxID=3064888 RepID=A0ABT9E9M6_9PROT|nr:phage tail sheath C-terminal domain-containing protein [Paracraurococcus sp. LOR1-02]MDO9712907.1 phage tail sheath subtilisin-like domain-containing protein [Paracraurococcus sp. LOR1-02]